MITQERLRQVLHYNRSTGTFTWRVWILGTSGVRGVAGTLSNGYRCIHIDGRTYRAGRLAWLYVKGKWPSPEVDHKNRNKLDDRFVNLRESSRLLNVLNRNYAGVTQRGKRWRAQIQRDGVKHSLGNYDTREEAAAVYLAAKKKLHPEVFCG